MATINRWDPFQDMLVLHGAMNQLMEWPTANGHNGQNFVPALDLSETENSYTVELAVPGLKAEDLEITFENNVLTIKGETRQNNEDTQRNYHRIERRYGSFQRKINLPAKIKAEEIKASLENGVLRLDVPKTEEIKPRKISISVDSIPSDAVVQQN